MYATVWNRVVLLASGVAFGWTLVHWLTVEPAQTDTQRVNVILSGVVGVAMVAWIAVQTPAALLMAAAVFGFSALVAYAANARQAGKVEAVVLPLSGLPAPAELDDRTAVVLAAMGEPESYDGPAPWMRLMRRLEQEHLPVPHWFVRPFTCWRIRQTFAAQGDAVSLAPAYADLVRRLAERLGPGRVVRMMRLAAPTPPKRVISALASEGFRRIVVLPVNLSDAEFEQLREHASASRVREAGVLVVIAQTVETGWPGFQTADRLIDLARGRTPSAPSAPPEFVEQLAAMTESSG